MSTSHPFAITMRGSPASGPVAANDPQAHCVTVPTPTRRRKRLRATVAFLNVSRDYLLHAEGPERPMVVHAPGLEVRPVHGVHVSVGASGTWPAA
jgi:hypothetical protein